MQFASLIPGPGPFGGFQEPRHPHLERPGWNRSPRSYFANGALVHSELAREHLLGQPWQGLAPGSPERPE
jgi:hypothetical protein